MVSIEISYKLPNFERLNVFVMEARMHANDWLVSRPCSEDIT